MRRLSILVILQAALCLLDTYLISRISLIGRIGIATVHREYRLLRSGWKTFFLFFAIQLLVIAVLYFSGKRYKKTVADAVAWILMVAALLGLIMTYVDFLHTYSHRLLKERFHLGFYLFWIGWMGSCVVFLIIGRHKPVATPGRPGDDNTPSEINDPSGS